MGLFDRLAKLGGDFGDGFLSQAETMAKALKDPPAVQPEGPVAPTKEEPQALMWDPYALIEQLGYKDKPSAITYGTLRAMTWKIPLVQAIIQTRLNQLSNFARPQRDIFQVGFRVRLKDTTAVPSAADKKQMALLEDMMLTTGVTSNPLGRDSLGVFLRKFARDSLELDQACAEIVKNKKGEPAQFFAVDAATIRIADTPKTFWDENDRYAVRTVQIYDNIVINEWDHESLAFCVRNPKTDIRNYGYGVAESEMLVSVLTSYLWGFQYNSKFFSQGSVAKGLINIKGPINTKQLNNFRRQWHLMVSGIENAWRTPIMNADDIQWLDMQQSNRDMEFGAWLDWLIKVIASVWQIDPMEVGFKYGDAGSRSVFESGGKTKLQESKDKGLKPLLQFIGYQLTNYIIRPINPDFVFEFVGLESQTQDELSKLNSQRVKTIHTVNELRAEQDLPPDPYGDIILDPTYVMYRNQQEMAEQGEMAGDGDTYEEADSVYSQQDFEPRAAETKVDEATGNEVKKSDWVQLEMTI